MKPRQLSPQCRGNFFFRINFRKTNTMPKLFIVPTGSVFFRQLFGKRKYDLFSVFSPLVFQYLYANTITYFPIKHAHYGIYRNETWLFARSINCLISSKTKFDLLIFSVIMSMVFLIKFIFPARKIPLFRISDKGINQSSPDLQTFQTDYQTSRILFLREIYNYPQKPFLHRCISNNLTLSFLARSPQIQRFYPRWNCNYNSSTRQNLFRLRHYILGSISYFI